MRGKGEGKENEEEEEVEEEEEDCHSCSEIYIVDSALQG